MKLLTLTFFDILLIKINHYEKNFTFCFCRMRRLRIG